MLYRQKVPHCFKEESLFLTSDFTSVWYKIYQCNHSIRLQFHLFLIPQKSNKCWRKPKGQSGMDNPDTQVISNTRHRMKTTKNNQTETQLDGQHVPHQNVMCHVSCILKHNR